MMRRTLFTRALSADVAAKYPFLKELGIEDNNAGCFDGESWKASGEVFSPITPITGLELGPKVQFATVADVNRCVDNMNKAKKAWAQTPAPKRGEIVRQIGDELRKKLNPLGELLALEVGKIFPEGKGEVQEYVDVCDYATGLSRQLPGQVLPSERPEHFMMEQWHPLGAVGIICAFNFPIAVLGWNSAIGMITGNTQIWKCAPTTTLSSIATQKIIIDVLNRNNLPGGIATFTAGGKDIGESIVDNTNIPLVSFTGSCAAGREVNMKVASRFGKSLLELGGNNAVFIHEDADVEVAIRGTLFGAVGTCGQRCTTCRRLYVHDKHYDAVKERLAALYSKLKIGNPLEAGVLVGPLHTLDSVKKFENTVAAAVSQGGKVVVGGKAFGANDSAVPGPNYVQPTIIEVTPQTPIVKEEAFVPILYLMKYSSIEEAIAYNNDVEQGLSSAIFTNHIRTINQWTGPNGSDTGICNVNIPTNGAEIGGAFGGEKATGGGRESGSDSWRQYMRRQTNTINYGLTLPLAQGIDFNVE